YRSLRPLTILVGPNDSGKSYLAMLIYSLFRAFNGELEPPGVEFHYLSRRSSRMMSRIYRDDAGWLSEHQHELEAWLEGVVTGKSGWTVRTLPEFLQDRLRTLVDAAIEDYVDALRGEIQRCFALDDIQDLTNKARQARTFALELKELKQHDPMQGLRAEFHQGKLKTQHRYDISDMRVGDLSFSVRRRSTISRSTKESNDIRWEFLQLELVANIMNGIFRDLRHGAYYLPAARSGILQSHKALASFMVQQSPFAGIRRLDIPRLSGVIADFISLLITLPHDRKGPLTELATYLENDVLDGSVSLQSARSEYPEIFYNSGCGSWPLHRVSSMVSELAPIVLLLKYIVRRDDLLIIEEPESHLHPGNQRKLAATIARMVRKGVRVLLTTHSDYFLSQLSNCVRRGQLKEHGDEYLLAEEVGAYVFATEEETGASVVQELPVSTEDGIPEVTFTEVAEALYDEMVQLQEVTP
ncbi:MAG: AAA family ATPase, partial [Chloroflexi bacterium]|nr:AAA family ATPase [Chloroflexota bacterium]